MIKYLGSKKRLLPEILGLVQRLSGVRSVVDLFSGTARVGHALKLGGYRVHSNDHNAYAHALAVCYVQADAEEWRSVAEAKIEELNRLPGTPGYFTETFCRQSRYFQEKNGARVDAIREYLQQTTFPSELRLILLVSLMEAADRVDSTTGVQMAYLKEWAPRAYNDLTLRLPQLTPRVANGKCHATQMDAVQCAKRVSADCFYLDPPYNQHKYLGNYHIWETLTLWDHPVAYGIARKREDVRSRGSEFNSRKTIHAALKEIIDSADCRYLLVSFSNEGFVTRDEMESLLSVRGVVQVIEYDFKRYVGAQIGIHNPQGEKVGTISHLRNREMIFVVSPHGVQLPALEPSQNVEQARLF